MIGIDWASWSLGSALGGLKELYATMLAGRSCKSTRDGLKADDKCLSRVKSFLQRSKS